MLPAKPPLRVLAYGDSLTAGYHDGGYGFYPYACRLSRLLGGATVRRGSCLHRCSLLR